MNRLGLARVFPLRDALRYVVLRHEPDASAVALQPRGVRFPLGARLGSSDFDVMQQIFVEREYALLDDREDVDVVVDCGAYVGYSSAYFLSRFPGCRLIAVEPNPANHELLRRNLAPYGARAEIIEGAVWSQNSVLAAGSDAYRDGREWTFHVEEAAEPGGSTVRSVTLPDLVAAAGGRISVLKMDVEGAEARIFSDPAMGWLDAVDTLVIELHDHSPHGPGTPVVHRAMGERGFAAERSGEVTIFRRPRAPATSG